jgi:hypothetical protein
MQKDIIIVENFYQDPYKVREYALKELKNNSYNPYDYLGLENVWKATRTKSFNECPFKSSASLITALNDITGEEINLNAWALDCPPHGSGEDIAPNQNHKSKGEKILKSPKWNCVFHIKPIINQKLGNQVHNHVSDFWNCVGEDGWVGLIYLNPKAPNNSGLFLWEHIEKRDPHLIDPFLPSKEWKLIDSLGASFNRLILCRGKMPHSGADGFSNIDEEGRLYQTFFFTTKKETRKVFKSIEISINI